MPTVYGKHNGCFHCMLENTHDWKKGRQVNGNCQGQIHKQVCYLAMPLRLRERSDSKVTSSWFNQELRLFKEELNAGFFNCLQDLWNTKERFRVLHQGWKENSAQYLQRMFTPDPRCAEERTNTTRQISSAPGLFRWQNLLSMLWRSAHRVPNHRPYRWWRYETQKRGWRRKRNLFPLAAKPWISEWISGTLRELQLVKGALWILSA